MFGSNNVSRTEGSAGAGFGCFFGPLPVGQADCLGQRVLLFDVGVKAREPGICYRSCNFCGSARFKVFKRIDGSFPTEIYADSELTYPNVGERLKLQYLECLECGLICINPLTVFADIDKHSFDGERNIVAWVDVEWCAYAADKLSTIGILYDQYEFEHYRKTNRILDVSCGPGVSLSWLRDEQGWEPFGIDPDRFSVRQARERYSLEIANGLIADVEAPDESFDIVMFDNSLEHTFDPLGTLLTAFRLLRKGGMMLVFVPNADGLITRVANGNAHWGHWFFYRAQSLTSALWKVGFVVPQVIGVQNPVHPEVAAKLDLTPYKSGLRVMLQSEEEVNERLFESPIFADYFNLCGVKPEDAGVVSAREGELRGIAEASRVERESVDVDGAPAVESQPVASVNG